MEPEKRLTQNTVAPPEGEGADIDMAVVVSAGQNEIEQMAKLGIDIVPHRKRINDEKLDEKFKDPNDPLRLVFVEQWEDQDALAAHFQKAESRAFVRALRDLLAEPAAIEIYRAEPLQMG